MWVELQLPYVFERMLTFSIPSGDQVLVVSYEGAHRITLAPNVRVSHDPEHAEGRGLNLAQSGPLEYGGRLYHMLGLYGGNPILEDTRGHWLDLDLPGELLTITDGAGELVQELRFAELSGDWGCATFSADGRWLVIGVPYDLYVYRWFPGHEVGDA